MALPIRPMPTMPTRLARDMGAQHLHRPPAFPLTRAQDTLALAGTTRRHQDQRQRDVGGGIRYRAGRIGHHNARRTGRDGVDVVIAYPEICQNPARGCRHVGKHVGLKRSPSVGRTASIVGQRRAQFVQGQAPVSSRSVTSKRARAASSTLSGRRRVIKSFSIRTAALPAAHRGRGRSAQPRPSASGTPRTSTSDNTLPIWRGGKFTTASTCRPTSPSGV